MGGVGYALHNNRQINVMNPASYVSMDSLTFLFDIGLTYQAVTTHEGQLSETAQSGSLDYIVMQFPLGRHMAGSIGCSPTPTWAIRLPALSPTVPTAARAKATSRRPMWV